MSIRKDIDKGYEFPIGNEANKCIQDILDNNVDSKYYLRQEIVDKFVIRPIGDNIIGTTAPEKTIGQRDVVYKLNGIMGTLTATDYKQPKQIIVLGDIDKKGWFDVNKRVYDKIGLSPTLITNISGAPKIVHNLYDKFTIRKLTPKECWRLMDFDKDAFNKVKEYISDSQSYKIAGNSIVVSCLEYIFINLKNQYEEECK